MCGAAERDLDIIEDKNTIITYVGYKPIFGEIFVCRKCGYRF